jgi:transcriptional regulator of acetoin/glycerol metabolism
MTSPSRHLEPQRGEHASHILRVVSGGPCAGGDDVVSRSWSRCVNEYRLHPDRPRTPAVVGCVELKERCARMADVIDSARYEMTTLLHQLADNASAVVLTDTDGVIVHMVASPEFAAEAAPLGLRAGVMWSETEAGTNGMGTCLAAAGPVAVRRDDHFFSQYSQLTCSAVPVLDPAGKIAGVLDVTSRSGQIQHHLLLLLDMTARMIEDRLIDRRFRDAHPLHFHSRPECVYTLHEGKLAVADNGRILAANRNALLQLGLKSADDMRSCQLEDLFQTSLEDLLRRSTASSFHPVVTYRANATHRFYTVVQRPAAAVEDSRGDVSRISSPVAAARPHVRSATARIATSAMTFADPRLVAHLATARRVIARATPVLLSGETGSGKEVFARAVHGGSPHASGAFVAINCASLPENLIESELFGYRAGAFTGAQRSGRRGKILQADAGTLFLDEIGDMPLDLQARLLRVLDERQIAPLGSEEIQAVDFQLVSASHRDLPALVASGQFREDLYYRLAGIELHLPALRERTDKREVVLSVLAAESGGQGRLGQEAERLLMDYIWPGNVRQLRHVLRSAVALADGAIITAEHLPALLSRPSPPATGATASPLAQPMRESPADDKAPGHLNPIQANERKVLLQMLEQHRWNVSNVAKALDVSRNTLYRKLHKLGIAISHPD